MENAVKVEVKPEFPQLTTDWGYSKFLDNMEWVRFAFESKKEWREDLHLPKLFAIYGIVGSGKSSLLENISNSYKTIIDIWACYDEATEVFTKEGWKYFKDITFQDEIATLNIKSNVVKFYNPMAIQCYDYDGPMIHFGGGKNGKYDLLVTPNHSMFVRQGYAPKRKLTFIKAYEILAYAQNHCGSLPFYLITQFPSIRLTTKNTDTEIIGRRVVAENYTGKVYDVTVPNHTLFVRRNGKTAWSGNSSDNEGLAWLRSSRRNSALLLKGPSVDVSSEWPCEDADKVKLETIDKYEVVVTCDAFYGSMHEQWWSLSRLMDRFRKRTSWKIPWCLNIREASNLIYARIGLGDNQIQAKNYIIYVMRQMRHFGLALVLDSLRWFSIDKDMRSLAHYRLFKAQGVDGLPDDLHWLYGPGKFDPYFVMRMPVDMYINVAQRGGIGLGKFAMPPWHKLEHENMLELLNIEVKTNEAVNLGDKNVNRTLSVGDFEHLKIIEERLKPTEKGRPPSMEDIAGVVHRSTRTIMLHINKHNDEVTRDGECSHCRRAKSSLSKTSIC